MLETVFVIYHLSPSIILPVHEGRIQPGVISFFRGYLEDFLLNSYNKTIYWEVVYEISGQFDKKSALGTNGLIFTVQTSCELELVWA
jgi:hypothetical protein